MDFYNYGYTKKDVFDWLKQHAYRLSHYAVLQTDLHPSNAKNGELSERTINEIKNRLSHFNNRFSYRLYGKKSRRKKHKGALNPVIISTIEGIKDNGIQALTCHINLLIGNLPANISQNEIIAIISDCWMKVGGSSFTRESIKQLNNKYVFLSSIKNITDAEKILNYSLKEGVASLDVENTIL